MRDQQLIVTAGLDPAVYAVKVGRTATAFLADIQHGLPGQARQ
jgi:hypothetical protein